MSHTKKIVTLIVVVILLGITTLVMAPSKPGVYDSFAKCVANSGVKFYGAFWCPHCAEQKALLGKSAKYLPYIECSTPDGNGQLKVCTDKGIKGYPTWIFPDNTEKNGVLALNDLSKATNCPLTSSK